METNSTNPDARSPADPARHIVELDGLRAVAIVSVMFYHFWSYGGGHAAGHAIGVLAGIGWAGVDVFFVLSGFLITGILLRSRDHPRRWRTFYVRRALRIFPLYYAVLLGLVAVAVVVRFAGVDGSIGDLDLVDRVWWNLLYLSNFALAFNGEDYVPLDISWSLAVEEQFYLVYPFLVFALRERALLRVLLVTVAGSILFRFFAVASTGEPLMAYALPFARFDQLALGGVVALMLRGHVRSLREVTSRLAVPFALSAFAFLLLFERHDMPFVVAGYTLTGVAVAAVMLAMLGGGMRRAAGVLRLAPLVWIGKVSYGLYLLHLFVREALRHGPLADYLAPDSVGVAILRVALMVALSCAAAWVSWTVFEAPVLRLKDRWAPASAPHVGKRALPEPHPRHQEIDAGEVPPAGAR